MMASLPPDGGSGNGEEHPIRVKREGRKLRSQTEHSAEQARNSGSEYSGHENEADP